MASPSHDLTETIPVPAPERSPLLGAPTANIETALHAGILALRGEKEPKERDYYHISSFGMCPRKQVAERAGLPPTNPADQRAIFKMWAGSVLHRGAQDALVLSGYLLPDSIEKRVELRRGDRVVYVGKMDGKTLAFGNGTDSIFGTPGAIVELKTADDDAISRYPEIPEHHLWQGFALCQAERVAGLVVLQLGRSQGLAKHRFFVIDAEWTQEIDAEVVRMDDLWSAYKAYGELPPHQHRFPWEARWCAYLTKGDA